MWSLTKYREGDSFSCIQIMLYPALSTLLSSHLLPTISSTLYSLSFCATSLERLLQPVPPSFCYICLLYTYLSHSCLPSIGSFPLFHNGCGYTAFCLVPSLFHISESLFSSVAVFLIFLRDNCAQALSSFFSLKKKAAQQPQRGRVSILVLYDVTDAPTQPPYVQNTHRNTLPKKGNPIK